MVEELLNNIYSGIYVQESIKNLIPFGKDAVNYILELHGKKLHLDTLPKNRDPRDAYDDLQEALFHIFKSDKEYYLTLLENGIEQNALYIFTLTWIAGALQFQESIPFLIKGLNKKDRLIRWSCCSSLIKFSNDTVTAALIGALKDRSSDVRITALEGLSERIDPRAIPNLTILLHDRYPGIREKAGKLLEKLNKSQLSK